MSRFFAALVAVLVLALGASTASAATVSHLSGDWTASNSTVTLGADGVHFGPYFNGDPGGTLTFSGLNGIKLSDVSDFSYTFNYKADGEAPGNGGFYTAAPFARIYLDTTGDGVVDTDVVLDAGDCTQNPQQPQNVNQTRQMVGYARLRYDDDACNSLASQDSWANIVAAHGSETVVGFKVSVGWIGTNVTALIPRVTINGVTYNFGSADPGTGPVGPQGIAGATGAQGPAPSCKVSGAGVRTIHAPSARKGERFRSARAWLRTPKGLVKQSVRGRTIRVNLPVIPANYNVKVVASYRKASGKVVTRTTERNISVTCA